MPWTKFFSKIHKTIVRLEEIFHCRICVQLQNTLRKKQKLGWAHQVVPHALPKTNLGISHAIMRQ